MVWLKRSALPQPRTAALPAGSGPLAPPPSGDVLARLRSFIADPHYPPGTRLPPERELAARLGVGRPGLREAIRALNALGVLESRRGAGTYVKSRAPRAVFDPLSLASSNVGLLELLEVRKMLEPRAAWLAAARAGEANLREIDQARRALEAPGLAAARLPELDLAFHTAVVRAARNPLLLMLYQTLAPLLLGRAAMRLNKEAGLVLLIDAHAAIAEAILRRQPDQAARAMAGHLESLGLEHLAGERTPA